MIRKYITKLIKIIIGFLAAVTLLFSMIFMSPKTPGLPQIISYVIDKKISGVNSTISGARLSLNLSDATITLKLQDINIKYSNSYLINIDSIRIISSIKDVLLFRSLIPKKIIFSPEIEVFKISGPKTKEEVENEKSDKSFKHYIATEAVGITNLARNLIGVNFSIASAMRSEPISLSIEDLTVNTNEIKDLILPLHVSLMVNEYLTELDGTLDASSDQTIFSGTIKNIPIAIFDELLWTEQNLLDGTLSVDLKFIAYDCDMDGFSSMQFEIVNHRGLIGQNPNIQRDISFNELKMKGSCGYNCETVNLDNIYLDAHNIQVYGSLHKDIDGTMLISANTSSNLTVQQVYDLWPDLQLTDIKEWLVDHLKEGLVNEMSMLLKLDKSVLLEGKELKKEDLDIKIKISDAELFYTPQESEENKQMLKINNASLGISGHDLEIKANECSLSSQKNIESTCYINFYEEQPVIIIDGHWTGPANDMLAVALSHSLDDKYIPIKILKGEAKTHISLKIPIEEDFKLSSDSIKASSELTNIESDVIYSGYKINKGNFKLVLEGPEVDVGGTCLINNALKSQLDVMYNISQPEEIKIKLNMRGSVGSFHDAQVNVPNFLSNKLGVNAKIDISPDTIFSQIDVDLKDTILAIPGTNIQKEAKQFSTMQAKIIKKSAEKNLTIGSYYIDIPNLKSAGHGLLSDDLTLLALSSDKTTLGASRCAFDYENNHGNKKIKFKGRSIDLSKLDFISIFKHLKEGDNATSLTVKTDIQRILMKNGQELLSPTAELYCQNSTCRKAKFIGSFKDGKKINIFYDYPVLSIVSDSAGNTLSSIGLNKTIRGGSLELKGKFIDGWHFDGNFYMSDYRMQGSPILSSLLTVAALVSTSFIGAAEMISGKGIPFRAFHSDISYHNGIFKMHKFLANGTVVSFDGMGFIDAEDGFIQAKGAMVPSNVINSFGKKIPIIGTLLAGGKDKDIIYTDFKIAGYIDGKIKVNVNPLSTFVPGFFNTIFNKKSDQTVDEMVEERKKDIKKSK